MATIETVYKEVGEIKADVEKILFILENEGEVREEIIKELEERANAPSEEYVSHEDVKKALM